MSSSHQEEEEERPKHVSSRDKREVLQDGTVIDGFVVQGVLGRGGFGDVYRVLDSSGKTFALKTEYLNAEKQALEKEIECLMHLNSPCFPRIHAQGTTETLRYIVMDVYGPSIGMIRRKHHNFMAARVALLLSLQMLKGIKAMHEQGYIHRDIKPSNFLLQKSATDPLVLVDFGLAVPYIDFETGEHLPQVNGRFCGTRKYASVNALKKLGLSRRDDLLSWFYSMFELYTERLPWGRLRDPDEIIPMMENIDFNVIQNPEERGIISGIWDTIMSLDYDETPNYLLLERRIRHCLFESFNIQAAEFNWLAYYTAEVGAGEEEEEQVEKAVEAPSERKSRKTTVEDDNAKCKCLLL